MPGMNPHEFVAAALGCDPQTLGADSAFGSHPDWDSLGHRALLAAIEEDLGIEIDTYSAERFSSMEKIAALPMFAFRA